jgi:urease accessory protein
LTTATLHFGGMLAGLGIRRYLASTQTWVMAGLGTLFGAAGLYLFGQM